MKKSEWVTMWNALLDPDAVPFAVCGKGLPAYRLTMGREMQVLRRYLHGGVRLGMELTLRGAAVCCCRSEEEALVEELYRRTNLLCEALPLQVGEDELLHCEMLSRPVVTDKRSGATIVECRLGITLRRGGEMQGMVPFLGGEGKILLPVGLFDLKGKETGGTATSRYWDAPSDWRYESGGRQELRFSFDRIIGMAGQDLLLKMSDRQSRGEEAVLPVYLADLDNQTEDGYRCVCIPMTIQIQELILEESGPVFTGMMLECGRRAHGWLWQEESGEWAFREWNEQEYAKGEAI